MRGFKLVCILLLLASFDCVDQDNKDLLDKSIKINSEYWTVRDLLDELTNKYKIIFSYEPPEIPLQKEVRLKKGEMSLKEVLNEAFKKFEIEYTVQSGVIILRKRTNNPQYEKKNKCSVTGIISDSLSCENIIGAIIYIEDLKTGEATNAYGFYSITLPEGRHQVQIFCIGYESLVKDTILKGDIRMDFKLKPIVYELYEVVISDKRRVFKDFQHGISRIEIKTVKELPSLFGEADLLRNIQFLPGVNSMAEIGGDFQVRGGSWDQNLMVLDEAVVYNSIHLYGVSSTFNPDIIKDVKFYKGSIPASYGGRISSVMAITQKEGNMKSFHASGGLGLIASNLTVEGPIQKDKVSFIIALRASYIGSLLKYVANDVAKDAKPYFYDINSKVNYTVDKNNRMYLSCYAGRDLFKISEQNQDYGNITGTLRFNHIFSDKLFSNTSIIYSNYSMLFTYQQSEEQSLKARLGLEHYEFKNGFSYSMSKNEIEFGLQTAYYVFHPGEIQPFDDSSKIINAKLSDQYALESAIYLDDNYKINSRTEIQIGIRFSNFNSLGPADIFIYKNDAPKNPNTILDTLHYKTNEIIKTYNNFEPRLSVNYNLTENQTFKFSYNKMMQYIQIISNTFNPMPTDTWKPSNKSIKPLSGNQFSLGWFLQLPDNSIDFSVESYYKMLENVLEVKPGTNLFVNNTLEAGLLQGTGRAYGLEFAVNKTKGRLTGIISYTFSRTERKIDGKFLEDKINLGKYYSSNYDIPVKISFAGEYKVSNRFFLTSSFIFQTGRPVTYPSGQYFYMNELMPYYSGKNQDRLPDFHRLDIGAVLHSRHKESRKWEAFWTFSVYNVYNRKNAYVIDVVQANYLQNTEARKLWFLGIVPSVSYNFKF